MDDPYKTLGLARDASADAVRQAYLDAARRYHPDLNPGDPTAEERFKAAAAANDLLSDPERRGQFDRGEIDADGQQRPTRPRYRDFADGADGHRYSRAGPQPGEWDDADLSSIFASMFNEDRPRGGAGQRGRDAHFSLDCAFLDAINGATLRLTLPDGRVLDVKVPAGTEDGQTLRLRGQAAPIRAGGGAGDALIEVHVAPHRFFTRDAQDIRLDLPVTLIEAVLGGSIEVPTPGGVVRMRVPPASDSGTELRLRGRGVPAHGRSAVGDLYATLSVRVGLPDAALETFLKTWTPEVPADPRAALELTP